MLGAAGGAVPRRPRATHRGERRQFADHASNRGVDLRRDRHIDVDGDWGLKQYVRAHRGWSR